MTIRYDFLDYVLDQFGGLCRVTLRRTFGGVGLYCDAFFFGLIANDTLYLRADASNRSDASAETPQDGSAGGSLT